MQNLLQKGEELFMTMLKGPVSYYFDTEEQFDKVSLESNIEQSLGEIRQQFKADGITAKYLQASFADFITLVNSMKGMSLKEQAKVLKQYGVRTNLQEAVELIEKYQGDKQQQQMIDLLKQIHYGQLINFDYKFMSK